MLLDFKPIFVPQHCKLARESGSVTNFAEYEKRDGLHI